MSNRNLQSKFILIEVHTLKQQNYWRKHNRKVKSVKVAKINKYLQEFLCNPGNKLFCQLCATIVKCDKHFHIEQQLQRIREKLHFYQLTESKKNNSFFQQIKKNLQ